MSKREQDPVSGIETTGHEWNGIKELDAPVPRFFVGWYGISINIALLLCLLLPAFPLLNSFTPGIAGYSERGTVERQISEAVAREADWRAKMDVMEASEIAADADLRAIAVAGGESSFKINCVACHGETGAGNLGYPNLRDDIWQWGGDVDRIAETLRIGINADYEGTRLGQMLAFGDDGLLEAPQIDAVVHYVLRLGALTFDAGKAREGATVYAEQCAACHGDAGLGNTEIGAPNLTDADWLYGADYDQIYATIQHGRQGWMPHWSERLDDKTIKMLAIYVKALGDNLEPLATADGPGEASLTARASRNVEAEAR